MKWIKRGLLLKPEGQYWWFQTHAMLPTIYHLEANKYRIFISGRDKSNRSQIGFFDILVKGDELLVLSISEEPVLQPGERGCFDDNGVTPSCIVKNGGQDFLYYIGWNSGTTTTRMSLVAGLSTGLASEGVFNRYSRAPLLERTNLEPFSILTAPFVMREDGLWHMWYVSCNGWKSQDLPIYNIKYASSNNGIDWDRKGHVAIDFAGEKETALARPWVIKENGQYKMFFSYKDPAIGYRLGLAVSDNAKDWTRKDDEAGIDVSEEGWDSEMIEYSAVFKHDGNFFLLYNGNGYGTTGVGYAVTRSIE